MKALNHGLRESIAGSKRILSMTEPPATNMITIDGYPIEYRLESRGNATLLILHGGHMSARCRFGEEIFLELGYTVLVTSRPGYAQTAVGAGPSAPEFRSPTNVSDNVLQSTLILATRNDGAVSFDHAEHLATTLPQATLIEVDTPTHLLWLGEGSDRTAAAINAFIGS